MTSVTTSERLVTGGACCFALCHFPPCTPVTVTVMCLVPGTVNVNAQCSNYVKLRSSIIILFLIQDDSDSIPDSRIINHTGSFQRSCWWAHATCDLQVEPCSLQPPCSFYCILWNLKRQNATRNTRQWLSNTRLASMRDASDYNENY